MLIEKNIYYLSVILILQICFGYYGVIQDILIFKYIYMDEIMILIENNYKFFIISIGEELDE